MTTNEIKITVDSSSVALDLLDDEIVVAEARLKAAAVTVESLTARRRELSPEGLSGVGA